MHKRNLVRVWHSVAVVLRPKAKHTSTDFFCSSLGLRGCDILGPIEGSTPLRASSSKSTRSTNLSPYVKILNCIEKCTKEPISPRGDDRTQDYRPSMNFLRICQTAPKDWQPFPSPNRPIHLACSLPWAASGSDNTLMVKDPP